MKALLAALLVVLSVATGCATPMALSLVQEEAPTQQEGTGRIFVYRDPEFWGSARGIWIKANGERVGGVNNATYFVIDAPPGPVDVEAENWFDEDGVHPKRRIDVVAGEHYYLRASLTMGFWDAQPLVQIVDRAEGEQAVADCKFARMRRPEDPKPEPSGIN